MNKEEYLSWFIKKKVILFGAGEYAHHFYNDFQDELNIRGCITNSKSERSFIVDNKEIFSVGNARDFKLAEDEIVITCAQESNDMQEQLSYKGLQLGLHYIDSQFYRVLVSGKKIALFYGVCYMRALMECLQTSKVFKESYAAWNFLDYVKSGYKEQFFFNNLLQFCDLFIYNTYLSPEGIRRIDALTKRLEHRCIQIRVPYINFSGMHPQVDGVSNFSNRFSVSSAKSPYAIFANGDNSLNRMIEEGKSVDQILDIVSSEEYLSPKFVKNNFEKECIKLRVAEQFADISVYNFFIQNYKSERLMLNESHMSGIVLIKMAEELLKKLHMDIQLKKEELLTEKLLYTSEIPLYPSVIVHLELQAYEDAPHYELFTYKGGKEVTFEEYIIMYFEICGTMMKYIDMGIFPE